MSHFKKTALVSTVSILLASQAHASAVRSDIDYQAFRDFAENKGKFTVGATNVPIKNTQGEVVGTMLNGLPMPDFSSVNKGSGIATLVENPQYIVSVAHNGGYQHVSFGESGKMADANTYNYQIADRNNYPKGEKRHHDYHVPRLSKLVTEVLPTSISQAGSLGDIYKDKERFPMFVRVGSGIQTVRDENNKQYEVGGSYAYLTGGTSLAIIGGEDTWLRGRSPVYDETYGKMASYSMQGDSGSPVFAYDNTVKKWVVVGVLVYNTGGNGHANRWAIVRPDYHQKQMLEDVAGTLNAGDFVWTANGKDGQITGQGNQSLLVGLADGNNLNNGKSVTFNGKGTLTLNDSINQGAGALHFNDNFTVTTQNDSTHLGAGVVIADGKTVNWQVKNPEGDRLSKLGKGTLHVNGTGQNLGDISVGEGTVILNQQADAQGNRQAFNKVGLTSGRGTVILGDKDQVNPDNIYFGYKGGRLDVNGHDLTFKHIQNVDDGAKIVNNAKNKGATITIGGQLNKTPEEIIWGKWYHRGGELYEYINIHANNRTDYFKLKGDPRWVFPTRQVSSEQWEYLGSDRDTVIANHLAPINEARKLSGFNGVLGETDKTKHNGVLNVDFQPILSNATLLLSGGSNLNGNLTVSGGKVVLSGRPTPYATGKMTVTVNEETNEKKYKYNATQDNFHDDDWINRTFIAKNFIVKEGNTLDVGRNVNRVAGNFIAQQNTTINLGITENSQHCIRSDYTGQVNCNHSITDAGFNLSPKTNVAGNLTLQQGATVNINKANVVGRVQAGRNTDIFMDKNATLRLTANSNMGNLTVASGSNIHLNNDKRGRAFRTLTVENLSGAGKFHYVTNLAKNQGDKLNITGTATGNHILAVANTGAEPAKSSNRLTLVSTNVNSPNTATFALEHGKVDVGALRYELIKDGGDYRLYNPVREAEIITEQLPEHSAKGEGLTTDELPTLSDAEAKKLAPPKKVVVKRVRRPVSRTIATRTRERTASDDVAMLTTNGISEDVAVNETVVLTHQNVDVQNTLTSQYTNTAISQRASDTQTLARIGQGIHQELSQDRLVGSRVWANTQYADETFGSNDYRPYDKRETTSFVGAENTFTTEFGQATLGTAISHTRADHNFADNIKGNSRSNMIHVYGKAQTKQGAFVWGSVGTGQLDGELEHLNQHTKTDGNVVSASVGAGKKFNTPVVDITPSVSISHSRLSDDNYNLDGATVQTNKTNLTSQTAQITASKQFGVSNAKITPHAEIGYTLSNDKSVVDVNGYDWQQHTKNRRYFNVGVRAEVGNINASAFVGQQSGDNRLDNSDNLNAGVSVGYKW